MWWSLETYWRLYWYTFLRCIDFHRHSNIFASFSRENLQAREAEVSTLPWTQTENSALSRCRNCQRVWRNRKLVLTLSADTDEEDHSLENEDYSGWRFCEYWVTFFQARHEGPRHHEHDFFAICSKSSRWHNWTIDQADFDAFLAF